MVYGQLILENAKIYSVDNDLLDQIFDFMVRDFSQLCASALQQAEQHARADGALPEDDPQALVDEARYEKVCNDHVYSLKDTYEMNP